MTDDILADIDAAIDEHEGYVEWHGSVDSATWTADGAHEVETSGHYYGDDSSYHEWRDVGFMDEVQMWEAASRPRLALRDVGAVYIGARRTGRTARALAQQREQAGLTPEQTGQLFNAVRRSARSLEQWQECVIGILSRAADAMRYYAPQVQEAAERVDEHLHPTVTADDRRKRPRRYGREAQESPYGPRRR